MQQIIPVNTPFGIFAGRDAVFLDALTLTYPSEMVLKGSFNGHLSSTLTDSWIDYQLTFKGIMALKIIELDSWNPKLNEYVASFVEFIGSDWIDELGGKVSHQLKHYRIQTYDDVIEVVCSDYELLITGTKPMEAQN